MLLWCLLAIAQASLLRKPSLLESFIPPALPQDLCISRVSFHKKINSADCQRRNATSPIKVATHPIPNATSTLELFQVVLTASMAVIYSQVTCYHGAAVFLCEPGIAWVRTSHTAVSVAAVVLPKHFAIFLEP